MRAALISAVVLAAAAAQAETASEQNLLDGFEIAVAEDGALRLPDVDFRRDWTMLGAWAVNGEDGADGFHVVYTQPGVAEAYRRTGAFPDGAVLIKELLGAESEDLTTGRVSYATEVEAWFIMVKDAENRYPDNPLWGDGWGWGYMEAAEPDVLLTEDYQLECRGCHVPAQQTDWIYTRAYPVLQR